MKVVELRSPFIIEINETGQNGSKIELFIWNGSTVPSTPTYTLSKNISSPTQLSTIYNVSNYIKEYIDNIKPIKTVGDMSDTPEDNNEWVKFRVKRYKTVTGVDTLLNTVDYIGVNGFANYTDGRQIPTEVNGMVLTNDLITKNILKTTSTSKNYFNFLMDIPTGGIFSFRYSNFSGTSTIGANVSASGIVNYKIPLTNYPESSFLEDGCIIRVRVFNAAFTVIYEKFITVNAIEECKYTPVECTFINRYGGWEFLTFFKAQSNSVSVKGTDYKLSQQALNYNTSIGQFKTMNTNGKQTVKLNTGFVDENYSELITDLLLSETVLLDGKPATVKSQSSDLKSHLKDKNINYEVEFEYAFNLINDVV